MTMKATVGGATLALVLLSAAALAQTGPSERPAADPSTGAPSSRASTAAALQFVPIQKAGERLASELRGTAVKNRADETIGSVSDLVLSSDGKVTAILVGVGGFLGIGSSDVGIPFDAVRVTKDKDGANVIRLEATRDELSKAPKYVTVKAKEAESRQQQQTPRNTSPGGGASK